MREIAAVHSCRLQSHSTAYSSRHLNVRFPAALGRDIVLAACPCLSPGWSVSLTAATGGLRTVLLFFVEYRGNNAVKDEKIFMEFT